MKKDYIETLQIAAPVIVGQLSTILMNITDNMVVGHLGTASLSAASFANGCYIFIAIFSFGALNPIPAVVAEARGAGNEEDTRQLLRASAYSGVFQGVLGAILVFAFSFCMPYLGQPEADVKAAIPFMWLLALSNIPVCIFMGLKGFFDGLERTGVGMRISILGLLFNLFFNVGFVFGKFGLPNWGLIGSAWATLLSRVLMMLIMLVVVKIHRNTKPYLRIERFDVSYFKKIIALGIPMGLQLFFEIAAFAGAVIIIGWLPNAEVARSAHQIAINMASMTFMVMLGLSIAGSVRVGEALGRKNKEDIRLAGNAAITIGVFVAVTCAILLVVFRKTFTAMYGIEDAAVQEVTIRLVIIAAIFQLFDGLQCIGAGLLRGLQDVKIPAIITFVAYIVLWMPLSYLLGFVLNYGVDGVWYAFVIALAFAALTLTWRFYVNSKKISFKNAQ